MRGKDILEYIFLRKRCVEPFFQIYDRERERKERKEKEERKK